MNDKIYELLEKTEPVAEAIYYTALIIGAVLCVITIIGALYTQYPF